MSTSPIIGIESVMTEPALAITKGYTGTPDQASGYAATNLADESPATEWRSTDTDPDSSRLVVRWGRKRYLRSIAGWEHNLERHAVWRWTADDEWAMKPVVITDGAAAKIATSAAIPATANVTFFLRFRAISQAVGNNTTNAVIFSLANASGVRFRALWLAGSSGTPYRLALQVFNWSSVVTLAPSTPVYPMGQWIDLGVRYRDSDKAVELWLDGAVAATGTASAVWPNNGDEALTIGVSSTGSTEWSRLEVADARYYSRYYSTAEMAEYRASGLSGSERALIGGWLMTEGAGTTAADVTGVADATITSGSWGERVRHDPRWSTGTLEAWSQWRRRPAMLIGSNVFATSPSLGNAPRSITLSGLIRIDPTHATGLQYAVWFGPTSSDAEVSLIVTSGGALRASSQRRAAGALTIDSGVVNDGTVRRWRIVLDGINAALSFYLAADGAASESLVGTASGLDAFATLASCALGIGVSSGGAVSLVSDVRLYREIVLEADDPLTKDVAVTPHTLAKVPLDESVYDAVDLSRVYTVSSSPAPTYEDIEQTASRILPAADEQRIDSAADPWARYQRLLVAHNDAAVEVVEGYLEIWDPGNGDGYIRLAVLLPQDGFQPLRGRGWNSERRPVLRASSRSRDGLVFRERGYQYDALAITLPSLLTDGSAANIADTDASEVEELLARLGRYDRERLVTLIASPWVAQHRLVENAVVGVTLVERVVDPQYGLSTVEITVESARKPPSD